MYSIINKSRKKKELKNKFINWLETDVYNKSADKPMNRVYKKDHQTPYKFKLNYYSSAAKKKKSKSTALREEIKSEAIKEALEDAEINYYGLNDYLTKDSNYNKSFKNCYDETYYENVDPDNESKELSIFDYM